MIFPSLSDNQRQNIYMNIPRTEFFILNTNKTVFFLTKKSPEFSLTSEAAESPLTVNGNSANSCVKGELCGL
ncbi:hypothetical protein AB205_0194140 [Aquarana catesbeiana]|uniref:Uncharacterized protein n=1 Tax=Aquarana catesbeiana TaxID=8400 RepID=A0A2G9RTW4_AQUCT|nr:hypothetical protein AB205_0194140 [Aquarana catesbeiana]